MALNRRSLECSPTDSGQGESVSQSSSDGEDDFEEVQRQTARKSTGAILSRARPSQIRAPLSSRPANNRITTYTGPTGLGRGKGGLSRVRRIYREREIATRIAISRQIRVAHCAKSDIPITSFLRAIKSICKSLYPNQNIKFQNAAILAMRESSEAYLLNMFEISNLFAIHAKRVTLFPRDIQLYQRTIDSGKYNSREAKNTQVISNSDANHRLP